MKNAISVAVAIVWFLCVAAQSRAHDLAVKEDVMSLDSRISTLRDRVSALEFGKVFFSVVPKYESIEARLKMPNMLKDGMTREDVFGILGQPTRISAQSINGEIWWYSYSGSRGVNFGWDGKVDSWQGF